MTDLKKQSFRFRLDSLPVHQTDHPLHVLSGRKLLVPSQISQQGVRNGGIRKFLVVWRRSDRWWRPVGSTAREGKGVNKETAGQPAR